MLPFFNEDFAFFAYYFGFGIILMKIVSIARLHTTIFVHSLSIFRLILFSNCLIDNLITYQPDCVPLNNLWQCLHTYPSDCFTQWKRRINKFAEVFFQLKSMKVFLSFRKCLNRNFQKYMIGFPPTIIADDLVWLFITHSCWSVYFLAHSLIPVEKYWLKIIPW